MTLPLSGKRIGLLTTSASRAGGGVAEAVLLQGAMIRRLGGEAVVFALADEFAEADRARHSPGQVHLHPVSGPGQIGFAPGLVKGLLAAELDLLHLHGIWMYPSRAGSEWARRTGRGYIISPHGMLDPWITARGRWKKALARRGYERHGWARASFLHALTAREASDIARETGRRDSRVIANPAPTAGAPATVPRLPHFAYIGRIHPKKNLLALVEAWARLVPGDGARLTIAGWGDADCVALLEAALAAGPPSANFVGAVHGEAKQALLNEARFTVLPSLSEGLPMAVLEGWAAASPAIMTEACNLPEGFLNHAAIECGTTPASIEAALASALALTPSEWLAMSQRALGLAAGRFSAEAIGAQWSDSYLRAIAMGSNASR
jgi:glycosyltransferase involved in cell wall biosynthesis